MTAGRLLTVMDNDECRPVCLVNKVTRDKLGLDRDPTGQFIEWNENRLMVIGLLEDPATSLFGSSETRTLNESAANIGGKELARLYFERYGTLEQACGAQPAPAATPPPTPSGFDFTCEMRALRRVCGLCRCRNGG